MSIKLSLERTPLYYPQPLANQYLRDFSKVAGAYEYNPYENSSFHRRLVDVEKKYPVHMRQKLSAVLREYNLAIGADEKVLKNIELISHNALVVLTGQQPGIFTGPLYTIYKALGVCLLSQRLTEELKVPVVPVFWVGAEDHDYQEINHVYLPTAQGPAKVELSYQPQGRPSVGAISLPYETQDVLKNLLDHCPGDYYQVLVEKITGITEGSRSISHWFASLMSWLFEDFGLVMADGMHPGFRQMQSPFIQRVLENNEEIEREFLRGYDGIQKLGFSSQVEYIPRRANLFIYHERNRVALYRDGDNFANRDSSLRWSKGELISLAAKNPDIFSLNVVIKPVAQDMMFPLVAYLAGPGELGYYALFKHLYSFMGGKMPVIYPRPSITLVEPRALKYFDKFNINPREFIEDTKGCIDSYIHQTQRVDVAAILDQYREMLIASNQKLTAQLMPVDSNIDNLAKETLYGMLKKLQWFEGKVEQRHRKSQQDSLRQLEWLQHQLLPNNAWQERVYNIMPYLAKYGEKLPMKLAQLPLLDHTGHNLVYMK